MSRRFVTTTGSDNAGTWLARGLRSKRSNEELGPVITGSSQSQGSQETFVSPRLGNPGTNVDRTPNSIETNCPLHSDAHTQIIPVSTGIFGRPRLTSTKHHLTLENAVLEPHHLCFSSYLKLDILHSVHLETAGHAHSRFVATKREQSSQRFDPLGLPSPRWAPGPGLEPIDGNVASVAGKSGNDVAVFG